MTNARLLRPLRLAVLPDAVRDSYQSTTSCKYQNNFTLLNSPGGVPEGLENILAFKIGIVHEKLFNGVARTDHSDSDPHSTNASLTTHDTGILRDAVELVHDYYLA